ncbi:MAG: metalloregulator ArsR/SmtB family transcription factor [Pyrinomonadaceae bacterium]
MGRSAKFKLEEFFAALADRTRLRLLNLMRDGEVCVCFFADTLGTNNPKISRHLSYLKRAGLVSGRRDGKWIHYSLKTPDDPHAEKLFEQLMNSLENDEEMKADRLELINVCCAPRSGIDPVSIQPRVRINNA